jgi:hypothetical protein
MFGRGVFLTGNNFHSIVIVVPLHVSKLSRVLKRLAAYHFWALKVKGAATDPRRLTVDRSVSNLGEFIDRRIMPVLEKTGKFRILTR